MELIYLYIERAYGEEYDLHMDFSQDLRIRWNKRKSEFTVDELTSPIPSNFFSNNVTTVTGIVGKNGSGKTTIVNTLLSFEQGYYLENSWLMIFKKGDRYYIEGTIPEAIAKKEINRRLYSFYGALSSKSPRFIVDGFLQDEGSIREELAFLTLDDKDKGREKHTHLNFQRFFASNSTYKTIFEFLIANKESVNFSISRKLKPFITFSKPNFIDDAYNSNPKMKLNISAEEKEFLNQLKNFWKSVSFLKKKEIKLTAKMSFLLEFSRLIFDSLFNCLLFFKYEVEETIKGLTDPDREQSLSPFEKDMLKLQKRALDNLTKLSENITSSFKNARLLDDANILKKHIKDMMLKLDFHFHNYITGVKIEYLLKPIFEFEQVFNIFLEMPDEYFTSREYNKVYVDLSNIDNYQKFSLLLGMFDVWNYKYQISGSEIVCDFGEFSSGEMRLIELFSRLNSKLIQIELEGYTSVILVLDEYEEHLHPEWARKFLSYLISFLTTFKALKIQLVLTTHSPYLVSDLPRGNVVLIENNQKTSKRETRKSKYGLASNYYDIMQDSFFLDDTVGEFAKSKIDECITEINSIRCEYENLNITAQKEDEEFKDDQDLDFYLIPLIERLKSVSKIVDLIDDQFIRGQLDRMTNSLDEKLLSASSHTIMNNELKGIEEALKHLEEKRLFLQKKLEVNND